MALLLSLVGLFALSHGDNKDRALLDVHAKTSTEISTPERALASPVVNTEEGVYHPVIKVIDGDTITIEINGANETLRLIGINTPETVDPRRGVECFGKEASAYAKAKLAGQRVRIEQDTSQDARDKYGRMLAYVFLADGTNWNAHMIRAGYAYEYTYKLPYQYQREFKDAELMAREGELGLWASGVCGLKNISRTVSQAPTTTSVGVNKNYACDKNTYNCTSFSTQAEAQSAFDICGGGVNDIHKLDSDKDGIVCEGLP